VVPQAEDTRSKAMSAHGQTKSAWHRTGTGGAGGHSMPFAGALAHSAWRPGRAPAPAAREVLKICIYILQLAATPTPRRRPVLSSGLETRKAAATIYLFNIYSV
jgi:hypothetical protein